MTSSLSTNLLCLLLVPTSSLVETATDSWQWAARQLPDFDCLYDPRADAVLSAADDLTEAVHSGAGGADATDSWVEKLVGSLWPDSDLWSDEAWVMDCPFGLALLEHLRWAMCVFDGFRHELCSVRRFVDFFQILGNQRYGLHFSDALPIFLNTRFADKMFTSAAVGVMSMPGKLQARYESLAPELTTQSCMGQRSKHIDWDEYHRMEMNPTEDGPGVAAFSWDNRTRRDLKSAELIGECCLGYMTIVLEALIMVQELRTEDYRLASFKLVSVRALLDDIVTSTDKASSLDMLWLSRWPIMQKLSRLWERANKRKIPFELDFFPWELLRLPQAEESSRLRSLSPAEHSQELQDRLRLHPSKLYFILLHALKQIVSLPWAKIKAREGWHGVDMGGPDVDQGQDLEFTKGVLFTMVWGKRLAEYIPGIVERARAFGLDRHFIIFCGGDEALHKCQSTRRDSFMCIPFLRFTLFNKHAFFSAIVGAGFDALYLDFDVALFQNPLLDVLQLAQSNEIAVSRDWGSECLNTGVIYAKAHPDSAAFFGRVIRWLWHHPYEFTQKAFSAFLGAELVDNKVSLVSHESDVQMMVYEPVPRWAVLEPLNMFVTSTVYWSAPGSAETVEGWSGNVSDIVTFHFLDGNGAVDPTQSARSYQNLFELIYKNPNINLSDTTIPLYLQDIQLQDVVFFARKDQPPKELASCILLPEL